jgi:hypothetical protein
MRAFRHCLWGSALILAGLAWSGHSAEAQADKDKQPIEAYVVQKDLETLMASATPVTTFWSMHTWGGIVEPIVAPGPEIGAALGPWTEWRDAMKRLDPKNLVKPLKTQSGKDPRWWDAGVNKQFGITAVLCEGGGAITTKEQNLESGAVLARALVGFYKGTKPPK